MNSVASWSSPVFNSIFPLVPLIAGWAIPIIVVLLAVASLAFLIRFLTHH